jgi:acyl carrier protein
MLNEADIQQIIFDALKSLNAELPDDKQIAIGPSTPLFGTNAEIDSLSLVSLIVDVETALNGEHDLEISLTDDRAMTREVSPFSDVQALKDYILELIAEGSHGH